MCIRDRKEDVFAAAAQEHLAAMHASTWKIAHNLPAVCMESKNDDYAACLIFSQKASRMPADDHNRNLFFVSFHMDSSAVSCVVLYINLSASHGVTGSIADIAADQYFAFVHCVTYSVLRIGIYSNMSII